MKAKLLLLLLLFPWWAYSTPESDISIKLPEVVVEGVEYDLKGQYKVLGLEELDSGFYNTVGLQAFFQDEKGTRFKVPLKLEHDGYFSLTLKTDVGYEQLVIKSLHTQRSFDLDVIPLWLSVIPPLLAILLALLFKEVLSSLFVGILSGTFIVSTYTGKGILGVLGGFTKALKHLVHGVENDDHAFIILFSIIIGGMVAVISANGGMAAIVNRIGRYAKTAVGGQFATWILGVGIFFDDYANTLVVGNTMRPMTDKLKISREKLAYIVDSTAAPIASIAFISTWIGAELGYIQDGINELNGTFLAEFTPYSLFIGSIKYSFYPILALLFILFIIFQKRDFGPMRRFEKAARAADKVESQTEIVSIGKGYLAWIPILVLILTTMASLLHTGSEGMFWVKPGVYVGKLSDVIGNANSYIALLLGSTLSLIVAVFLTALSRQMKFPAIMEEVMKGFKSMMNAVTILVLAWALSEVTKEMHTGLFVGNLLVGNVNPVFLPVLTFAVSALVAFSTGSSWSTMAILYIIVLPVSYAACADAGLGQEATLHIFLNVLSSVLAGAVMGDHCSPISDTTILSSLASDCDHISHVKTQIPYALTVGLVSMLLGTLLVALGVPIWLCYLLCIVVLFAVVRWFGKPVEAET